MTTDAHPFRKKIAESAVLGTWSLIPSPTTVEILGRSGMDFVILDAEHGPYDPAALEHAIRACETALCLPIVRVSCLSHPEIQSALDLGAAGIVVPRIKNIDEAKEALAAMHFPPAGTRGFNPFTRAFGYDPSTADPAKQKPFSCIIVEEEGALKDLEKILALPDLDCLYVGVYDLSVMLGCSGDVTHPKVQALAEELITKITAAGKIAGLMVGSEEEAKHALVRGVKFLVWKTDTFIIRRAATEIVNTFRHAAKRSS